MVGAVRESGKWGITASIAISPEPQDKGGKEGRIVVYMMRRVMGNQTRCSRRKDTPSTWIDDPIVSSESQHVKAWRVSLLPTSSVPQEPHTLFLDYIVEHSHSQVETFYIETAKSVYTALTTPITPTRLIRLFFLIFFSPQTPKTRSCEYEK
jgi:hypothetical protein